MICSTERGDVRSAGWAGAVNGRSRRAGKRARKADKRDMREMSDDRLRAPL
jgi:hypothetical protein